jgi:DNA polymerase-3 subunit gamma/tau
MSNYVVSARKYRPQKFEEVVGQGHVANTLKNAIETDQLAHAYLFCGPRGVGKTTCARILAKTLNCTDETDKTNPCGKCESCLSFERSASFNILELDAASNNSVDHIRTLNEQVRIQPTQGSKKIFIIDEVHMLSSAAFNAFLKTLEEPPPYAVFILATTEKHKIIPTILSRCQIYDFKRIQVKDIVVQLEHIIKAEGITAEAEALNIIGAKADGAMRDALSIYDRVASASGGNITYDSVIQNLNILDYEYYFNVVDRFMEEDMPGVIMLFHEILNNGFEASIFLRGLAEHLRKLLLSKDSKTLTLLDSSEELTNRYLTQGRKASLAFLLNSLNIVTKSDLSLAMASDKTLHTEVLLGKLTYLQRAFTIDSKKKIPVLQ